LADGNSAITSRRLLWLPTTHLEYSSWKPKIENHHQKRKGKKGKKKISYLQKMTETGLRIFYLPLRRRKEL